MKISTLSIKVSLLSFLVVCFFSNSVFATSYPVQIEKSEDKIQFLYRNIELLRLEHNQKISSFKTEKEKKEYIDLEFRPKLKNLLFDLNFLKESLNLTLKNPLTLQNNELAQELKGVGINETKWDGYIDVSTLPKLDIELNVFPDPLIDYTTWTEVDPNGRITVSENTIEYAGLTRSETAHIYNDYGVDFFDDDFEHLVSMDKDTDGSMYLWVAGLSNVLKDYYAIYNDNDNAIFLSHGWDNVHAELGELNAGSWYGDQYSSCCTDPRVYVIFERDVNVGTYGTLYGYVYSDASRETLVDTLSLTLHADLDYQYYYALNTYNDSGGNTQSGYIYDLDLSIEIQAETSTGIATASELLVIAYTKQIILLIFFDIMIFLGAIVLINKA
ncbi:hypothetical protein ACFLYY_02655 [Patescibacteria group bacterium]